MEYKLPQPLNKLYTALFNKLRYHPIEVPTADEIATDLTEIVNLILPKTDQIISAADFDNNDVIIKKTVNSVEVFQGLNLSQVVSGKEFVIRMSQAGTAAPTVDDTLINALGVTVDSITRLDTGLYRIIFTDIYTISVGFVNFKDKDITTDGTKIGAIRWKEAMCSESQAVFWTVDNTETPADGLLINTLIEFKSYG